MTQRVDLPDGHWAEIRTRKELTERARRAIAEPTERLRSTPGVARLWRAMDQLPRDASRTDLADRLFDDFVREYGADPLLFAGVTRQTNDLRIVHSVAAWSYDVPISLDGLLDLPGEREEVYDALLVAVDGVDKPTDFGATPAEDSPTSPSPGSGEG